ncbi:C2H2-type zinc finger protein [Streptomyces xinghaiensis]|uniref:C2H2-type zinc finger protein n=1 Tax=Streptomyces xinghaiensis TaxID=1038928 RepID=UPI00379E65D9
MTHELIRVQPARHLRREFARWAVAQRPKVRTVSESAFGVPPRLFTHMPERLLRGSLIDGHRYVSPGEEQDPGAPTAPTGGADLLGVATEHGFLTAARGGPLPDVPEAAYGPDTMPLPPPDFMPLEDAPSGAPGPETPVSPGDTAEGASRAVPAVAREDAPTDGGDTAEDTGGDSDSSDPEAKAFPCPHCPRSFKTLRGVDVHSRRAHPEV